MNALPMVLHPVRPPRWRQAATLLLTGLPARARPCRTQMVNARHRSRVGGGRGDTECLSRNARVSFKRRIRPDLARYQSH